jgi:hypothetical protein
MNKREFLPEGAKRKERSPEQVAAAAPFGLDFATQQVGVVGNVTIAFDPALGAQGLTLAQQLLNRVAGPYEDMQSFFGIAGGAVEVVIAPLSGNNDGSGGAYHYGCDFTSGSVLYLDATFASTTVNPLDLEVGLYVAELSESFMGPQGGGWGCGSSNGEGLSRFCAELETPLGTLDLFSTGSVWAQAGFPDWVSRTEGTDQHAVSTGCAIVYIYWMRSLGFTVSAIVQAAGATLSANYQRLTGKTTAYQDLRAALQGLSVVSDNPFAANGSILWHHSSTNETQIWFMDRQRVSGRATVLGEDGNPAFVGLPFSIVGVGDFNGDGKADILWHHSSTNETQIWFMDRQRVSGRATVLGEDGNPAFVGLPFSIVGVGYFH